MRHEIDVALRLARQAGDEILRVYASDFEVATKQGSEPVTEADRRADALIRFGLMEAFPGDGVLTEESPDDLERLEKRRLWIVDPLDGTKQFVHRVPEFAVMIGLAVEGRAVLGVVHLPCENLTYAAIDNEGCVVHDASGTRSTIRVDRAVSEGARPRVAISRAIHGTRTERALARLEPIDVVSSGSVGRKAVLVARGDADAYFTLSSRSHHWDACAPEVIVREAGGFFGDARGHALLYNTEAVRNERGLLACRPEWTARFVDVLGATS